MRFLMAPMGEDGVEPIGSMGTDTPLAALSDRPYLLYNYFKQLFAQVTNPPLDAIREEIVTSTLMLVGSEGNLLKPGPGSFRLLELESPILTNAGLEKLRSLQAEGFRAVTLPILFPAEGGGEALERAMEDLFAAADRAIAGGANILILSDRGLDREHAPIPALLAVSGLHHHLIRSGSRMKVSLVLESGEPREVHHMALLVGYGASAINPYLAFETLEDLAENGLMREGVDYPTAEKNYVKALTKGIVKTMSKMGTTTRSRSGGRRSGRWSPAGCISGGATGSITCSTRTPSTGCRRPSAPATTICSGSSPAPWTISPATTARCAAC
jgi:glutamate synthase (ferredoxin)